MSAMPRHAARLRREAQLLRPREALDNICCGQESVQRAAGMAAGIKHLTAPGPGEPAGFAPMSHPGDGRTWRGPDCRLGAVVWHRPLFQLAGKMSARSLTCATQRTLRYQKS